MTKEILIIIWHISVVWGGLELLVWIANKRNTNRY